MDKASAAVQEAPAPPRYLVGINEPIKRPEPLPPAYGFGQDD